MQDFTDDQDLASIRLLISDIDQTLFDDGGRIPHGLSQAIHDLAGAGVVFCPASGRPVSQLYGFFPENHSEIAVCADNGGLVMYQDEIISKFLIEPSLYREVMDFCISSGSGIPMLCSFDRAYVLKRDRSYDEDFRTIYPNIVYVDDYSERAVQSDKISLYYPDGTSEAAYNKLYRERFGSMLHVTCAGDTWLDFMGLGVNKGTGVKQLCQHFNIDLKDAAAVGDTFNDIEMLECAGHSYLVANALPHMKKHANFRIPSNNDGGVLTLIKAILKAKARSRM